MHGDACDMRVGVAQEPQSQKQLQKQLPRKQESDPGEEATARTTRGKMQSGNHESADAKEALLKATGWPAPQRDCKNDKGSRLRSPRGECSCKNGTRMERKPYAMRTKLQKQHAKGTENSRSEEATARTTTASGGTARTRRPCEHYLSARPAEPSSSQASTTRAAMESSASRPHERGSYCFLLPTSPSILSTPS